MCVYAVLPRGQFCVSKGASWLHLPEALVELGVSTVLRDTHVVIRANNDNELSVGQLGPNSDPLRDDHEAYETILRQTTPFNHLQFALMGGQRTA